MSCRIFTKSLYNFAYFQEVIHPSLDPEDVFSGIIKSNNSVVHPEKKILRHHEKRLEEKISPIELATGIPLKLYRNSRSNFYKRNDWWNSRRNYQRGILKEF